ncbi:MAG: DNA mismatch repair protein MutS [Crocinitomicaceae bacterium]|nr:DNA mismatch repair protein MutS [Crocinitomicaceae bacterium]
MHHFDEQTVNDLEFPTIREWLVAYVIGPTAKKRMEELSPSNHFPTIEIELRKVNELLAIREQGEVFPALDFEELQNEIKLLPIRNSVLLLEGYIRIARASDLVNSLLYFFDKREKDYPLLSGLFKDAYYTKDIIEAIEKVFDRAGNVKDDASKLLYEIRQKIKTIRNQINRNFDKEVRRLVKENVLGDTKEAFVNDRRVLTILSTHKRKISGTVVGSSKTGSLTFIEPQVNIQLNNELEMLLDDERKEIYRILQALTKEIALFLPLIQAYQAILTELDFINAKTRLALELNCVLPGIENDTHIEIINAYHPILWKANKAMGKKTLPQYIHMDKFSRMLVISGPNAGGKSITLKTIGLLQLMLQAGLLVPVDANSKMCFFQQILSDIGDNQSIENELSTYSYRLKRMKHFLEVSNKRTLLLLDEFGTGSDPDLGGALAEVFFEELYNKKSFGVITTHYANIKLKADQLKNAINGCMLFDTETLEPLYRFSIGQPGSSFTFEVAQINGIPLDLIEEAKTRLDVRKVSMDRLLSELQKEKTYLERLNHEHIEAQRIALESKQQYEERKKRYDEKLATQQDTLERNNKFVNAGKKMSQFIDRYLTKSRKKDANQPLFDEIKKYLAVEKAKIEDAKLVEKLKSEVAAKNPKKQKPARPEQDPHQRHKIQIGSTVKLIATKQAGTVESMDGDNLTVTFGFLRMKVEKEKLMWVK